MKAIKIIKQCRALGINLSVINGQIKVQGAKSKLTKELVEDLKQNKVEVIQVLEAAEQQKQQSSRFTLSDFPLAQLEQSQLQSIERDYQHIQDLYVSTAMQRGMLFHGMLDGEENAYVNVTYCDLFGELDIAAFKGAWQAVVAKHDIFRTCFVGFDFEVIHQLVQTHCELDFEVLDWSQHSDLEAKLDELRAQETRTRFDFGQAPLMRWKLVKLAESKYHFIWSNHHALLDGWCSSLVFSEVLANYIGNTGVQLPHSFPAAVPYKNYIQWLRSQSKEAAQTYWRSVVGDISEKTELPMVQSDIAGESEYCVTIAADLTEQLVALAKRAKCTVNVLVQAAWSAILHYYTGDEKVVFGATISGRPATLANVESIVGLFINSLPVAATFDRNASLQSLFNQLQQSNTESQEYGYFSLAEIQQLSDVSSGSGLFDSLVVFENYPIDTAVKESSAALPIEIENVGSFGETNFPLTLVVSQSETIHIKLRYKRGLFSDSLIATIASNLQSLLGTMSEMQTSNAVGELLGVVLNRDEHSLQTELAALANYEPKYCLHEIFEQQVEQHADRIAVVCNEEQLSYAQLNQKANQLAHLLREKGVKPDALVALCLDRNVDMVVALLAVLKAGGAYVPVDPRYPQSHLTHVLQDAKPSLVITVSAHAEIASDCDAEIVELDSDMLLTGYSQSNVSQTDSGVQPHHLAYVIYTSGSTGKPKGVMIEHHNVVRLMASAEKHFQFSEHDTWTLFHSYAFDFSVWELWGAFFYGGKLVVVDYAQSRDPVALINIIEQHQVSVLNQTPSAFYQLLANLPENALLASLRYVVFGGEALETQKLVSWFARAGCEQTQLVNMYGITETTVHVTFAEVNSADKRASGIGKPLDDLAVLVCNPYQEIVPQEVTGEMLVTGGGLARGYLNRPELNAERFVELTIAGRQVRCYRSGDLCKRDAQGNLFYQGRIDHQVKVRGFRIELGEIQYHLLQHPALNDAVVIADQMPSGDKRLVAYFCVRAEAQYASSWSEVLREFLAEKLPAHMIPALFVEVESFKLTNNGKVDLRALPKPESAALQSIYVAPSTELQIQLCTIWQTVFQTEQVGIEDNFFSLGGDSILAIRITAMAKQQGIDLTLSDLFELQSIAKIAALDKFQSANAAQETELQPFALLNEEERNRCAQFVDAYPLSTLQEGMVFHTVMEETMYHDIMSHHIEWQWDESKFAQALANMVEHHPILRTSYDLSGDRPLQRVHASIPLPLQVVDISGQTTPQQDQFVADWIEQEKRNPFIWEQAPLFRLFIHLRGENSFQFTLSCHHSILDGWSVVSLKTELYGMYRQLLNEQPMNALELDWAQRDFVAQELSAMSDQQARDYWMSAITDAPNKQIPELPSTPNEVVAADNVVMVEQVNQYAQSAIKLARQLGVPLQHVLLAVHFKVLAFVSGSDKVISCVTNNGRPEKQGGDSGFGLFLNLLPVSINVQQGSWAELIQTIKQTMIDNAKYRHFPLSIIQRESQRDFSEVTFNYTHFHGYQDVAGDQEVSVVDSTNFAQANFDFKVMFQRAHESDILNLAIRYNQSKYSHQHISMIADCYLQALQSLVSAPEQQHAKLSLIQPKQLAKLDSFGVSEKDDRFATTSFVKEFEAQCELSPQTLAVVVGSQQLTYEQLNQRANRLAHFLLDQGLGQGDYIGIFTLRNLELYIAMLAVQKIGAAYVLIEPNNTQQRIKYILDDADIELVLTQSSLIEQLPLRGIDVLTLEESLNDPTWLEEYEADNLEIHTQAEYQQGTAYVIYTSGTTGQPKGVEIAYRSMTDYLCFASKHYFSDHLQGSIVSTSHGFDLAIPGLLLPLMRGKTANLAPWGEEIESLKALLLSSNAGCLVRLTPMHIQAVLDLLDGIVCDAPHTFVIGGDTLTMERLFSVRHVFPKAKVFNHYGPTETVVGCTIFDTSELTIEHKLESVPIGKPMDNTQVRVLDKHLRPVPVGTTGELFVAGECVAKGYLNKPELTAEKFITLADNEGVQRRFYRTGDQVRWLADGNLQFGSRIDGQVKVRGYRVELAEIESVLRQTQLVKDVAVITFEQGQELSIAAYVVPNESCISLSVLQKACTDLLPSYMYPSAFVELERLPTNANGKLDKSALPNVSESQSDQQHYVAPETADQRKMCAIWEKLLDVPQVGIRDDFFALGGHSLLATRLINIIKKETGKTIPLKALFAHSTVEALCNLAEEELVSANLMSITPISQAIEESELTEEGEL
ncbi:amino acid adenylation domain-containing protein [Pseudoalteromonas sp. T1lg65]|uniref:amino acid adenylation domain-containing protein n=1 Tax=Pseudoalteromonas sp. T1lg65 TaxID=2077101 RepID=UPI003F79668B